jgi:hypothetical protein
MSDKKPRKPKKKDQIAWEMKQKQDATRKRAFVGEVFFPLLKKHTKSIHQAKQVCKIFQNDIMSTFNQGMKNPVATLDLAKKMEDDTSDGANAYRELAEAFKDLTIAEAAEIIGGMPEAIDGGLSMETWGRSLDDIDYVEGMMKLKQKPILEDVCKDASCNDLRQLGDGTWMAYSTKVDAEGIAFRANGATPLEAVLALKEMVYGTAK